MTYIQSDKERTRPHHFDCASAMFGCIENALPYRLTSFEEVVSGKFDSLIPTHLFVGSVEFMREVFSRIGKSDVRLPINSNRPCEIITLGEAQRRAGLGEKIFIKPTEIKLFTGFVLDGSSYSCLSGLSGDTKLMAYKPFEEELKSEWRLYIYRGEIVDSRLYSGDFSFSPYYPSIYSKIIDKIGPDFPIAYTIDIGCFDVADDVVVEFNDMWAIGNYGMDNTLYLRMLRERYFEIIRTNGQVL